MNPLKRFVVGPRVQHKGKPPFGGMLVLTMSSKKRSIYGRSGRKAVAVKKRYTEAKKGKKSSV